MLFNHDRHYILWLDRLMQQSRLLSNPGTLGAYSLVFFLEGARRLGFEAAAGAVAVSSGAATAFAAVFRRCWPRPLLLASSERFCAWLGATIG